MRTDVIASAPARSRFSLAFPFWRHDTVGGFAAAVDLALILGTTQVAHVLYRALSDDVTRTSRHFAGIGLLFAVLFLLVGRMRGFYTRTRVAPLPVHVFQVLAVCLGIFGFLAFTAFVLKIGAVFSRSAILLYAMTVITALGVNHYLWSAACHGAAKLSIYMTPRRRVVVVGFSQSLAASDLLAPRFRQRVDVVATVSLDGPDRKRRNGLTVANEVVERCRTLQADEVVLAANWRQTPATMQLLRHLRVVPLPVNLLTDQATRKVLRSRVQQLAGMTMIEVQPAPMTLSERASKRALDIAVAGFALFLAAPLMLLAMAAIKLESPGPALFRQSRRGFNGVPFKILKFRSMTVMEDGKSIAQAQRQDSRVTRVGRFIRATSIDELPQLWNILRGEMSLVGPRPHAVAHDNQFEKIVADYAFRHHIKPGLTGWAQVNGSRGPTPTQESIQQRVDLDLWYVNNRTLRLDFAILARTALLVFRTKDVY